MNTLGLSDLLYKTTLSHPLHRARFSEQTWVNQRGLDDPVLNRITERYNYNKKKIQSKLVQRKRPNCPAIRVVIILE